MKLNEAELSEYCRKNGLYEAQVRLWQENCLNANGNIPGQIAEMMQQDKMTQRELRRLKRNCSGKNLRWLRLLVYWYFEKKRKRFGDPRKTRKTKQYFRSRNHHSTGRGGCRLRSVTIHGLP
ncbi:hypothetical protein [Proteiniclasticum ruminis]|uniref:hypothetical protein n=1 Tax=Proteiniclasticum ruminis TaxID=398199 RepID=UPI000943D2BA|nr:hypothetical protein [Proteiniclasticum ruminis]